MLTPAQQKNIYENVFERMNQYVPLERRLFDQMLQLLQFRTFRKKEKILEIGQMEQYFNMVCVGLVRKYIEVGKKETTLQLATEGHFVHSELSFFRGVPTNVTIEALEPTVLISISREQMEALYLIDPVFETLGRLMVNDMFIRKDHRYFVQLKYNNQERFLQYMEHHSDMVQRVPQKYLASYLNMKPETFSRLKHLLRKKKVT